MMNLFSHKFLARAKDPVTSKQAAKDVAKMLPDMAQQALVAITAHPGRTARELDFISGTTDGQIRKRLNDLRRMGKAYIGDKRRCTVSKKLAQTWWPTRDSR